jgi:DNA polymerase-3 subunit alpha
MKLERVSNPFPHFDVPPDYTLDSYFEHVAREGFARRLEILRSLQQQGRIKHSWRNTSSASPRTGHHPTDELLRLFSHRLGLHPLRPRALDPRRPGARFGRRVARLLCALGITDIDPLQHELLFERFLNPERISLPDIDIDFCMNRRGEVINYVTQKYGRDNVAQIITFGTMAAKAAIKDVGRAMDIPYSDVDRIAKMVPATLNIKLEEAIRESPRCTTPTKASPR